jgi:hypothetical protein
MKMQKGKEMTVKMAADMGRRTCKRVTSTTKENKNKQKKINISTITMTSVKEYLLLDAASSAVAANARIFATVDRQTDTQLIFIW